MFQLTEHEWQFIIDHDNRSQIVTASLRNRNKQYLPFAFTEHGVTMLASVLRSDKAVAMNILIVRAFISLRYLSGQYEELAQKLSQLENSNKKQFMEIYQVLNFLVEKKQAEENFNRRQRIGFNK